ncbi:MAG: hypothetical protein CMJ49_12675 [Planctomycetaceae bacterium]|nr:hypothetical protein [Planctomycetaceae bacterium]
MANISYDDQCLAVDGRRVWLVSGSIHYARVPHELWRDRIRAAQQAELNCIDTQVIWAQHELTPGSFRFTADCDLRRFVELIASEGMWCILRPGPYVGAAWDFGGLPPWLHELEDVAFRQSSPAFLQATARYLDAVMDQVRDLQVTNNPAGPIILVQNENQWFCHNDADGEKYLGEINRYLRESGCKVPITNCNNLWQPVSGSIDCWSGADNMLATCRQLRIAQSDAPRIIADLWTGDDETWGRARRPGNDPQQLLRTLAEVSAAGAMFNLHMFHGGTSFGFSAGRSADAAAGYCTTSRHYDAPLGEAGSRGGAYALTKRLATFLSRFESVLAHLRPADQPTVAASGVSVVQQSGDQGHAVFLLRESTDGPSHIDLVTPIGQSMTVHLGSDLASWLLLDVNLDGVATLDLTNLRPFAFVDRRLLVLWGPAGTDGLISIDGTPLGCTVPTGKSPEVIEYDQMTIVVLNEKQIDAAYLLGGELFIGVSGFDAEDQPIRCPDFGLYTIIAADGTLSKKRAPETVLPARAPRLLRWRSVALSDYIDGTAPRYATIEGPRSVEQCGADYGYAWYRLRFDRDRDGSVNLLTPDGGDRLHLYLNGKPAAIIGSGAGAINEPVHLSLGSGTSELVVLADNLGRFSGGQGLGERKGLFGHLLDVTPLAAPKPTTSFEPIPDPFELSAFVHAARHGDRTPHPRYTFTLPQRSKPTVLTLHGSRPMSVVIVNDQPECVDPGHGTVQHLVIETARLRRQANQIVIAPLAGVADGFDITQYVGFHEVREMISRKADWWYARWAPPEVTMFTDAPTRRLDEPCWHRAAFSIDSTVRPLWLEIHGLSKGQIYINGYNAGRYFSATADGKSVGPQQRLYLPEPWLNIDDENELMLFDEHGKSPNKCKLIYDEFGPYKA